MARGMSQQLRLWCLIFSGLCLQVLSLSPRRSGENCSDIPGWADSEGYTCAEYANKSWCTSEGRPGRGWSDPDSGLEDLWNDGYSAQAACCTCGGGQVSHINGMWQVLRGSCIVEGKCIMSPNYPENYSTDEGCVILVNNSLAQPLKTVSWDVEYWFDYLKINNRDFSGAYQPDAGLIPNGSIYWISDEDVTGKGWKLCANNSVPEALAVREPEVVTTSASPASASSLPSSSSSRSSSDTTAAASSTTISKLVKSTTTTTTTTTVESTTTTTTTTVESTRTEKRSSSTEPRSEPPNDQCADVDGWEDSADFTCAEYVEEGWCTPSGRTGERWNPMWGEPSDYWYAGFSALEACCACGGGKIKEIPDLWMILSGPCSIVDGCIESPNYPSNYSNNQRCTILVNDALARPIEVVSFATEYGYDKLFINGRPFSGRRKPLKVLPHYSISWESDEDTTDKGWKLCPGQHFRGPGMFSPPEGPCTLDAEGCVLSPNYPDNYGPNQDCAIQVFNPENRSITVEKFSTEMLYDVMWVNGRMYAGKASPHGLVPREAIQWSTDEDTQDSGWKLCPGPVGQQVENIGGIDEEEGKDEDEYGYQGASGTSGTAAPRSTTEASGSQLGLEEDQNFSGNFIFKAALAAVALCLGGVLCLRFRRRSAGREEYGTRYGRSYVMDNL